MVVPTLGERPELLIECLKSIKASGQSHTLIIAPRTFLDSSRGAWGGLVDSEVVDPGNGLAAAINAGINSLPKEIKLVTWLGDDDLLCEGALETLSKSLASSPRLSGAFGRCEFINSAGEVFGESKLGRYAVALLPIGPDYIPQPASAFRRVVFEKIGGLDTSLKFAFDLDLFLRLAKQGPLHYLDQTLARYRWHNTSLSSANQAASRAEARIVRRRSLPKAIRPISFLWEVPMETLAKRVRSLDRKSKSNQPQ